MKHVKPVIWSRPLSNGLYQVKIRVTENRKSFYVNTDISIKKNHWNSSKARVKSNHENANYLNKLIDLYLSKYLSGEKKQKKSKEKISGTLGFLLESRIDDFRSQSRMSAVRRYNTLLNHIKNIKLDKVLLCDLTMVHRQRLDSYFINEAQIENSTRNTYHKVIRTSIKYAEGLPEIFTQPQHNIYHNHKVLYRSKTKVTLKADDILRMNKQLNFPSINKKDLHALRLFLFSFAAMGMRFKDVILLKWENITDGFIEYTMSKNLRSMKLKLNENIVNVLKFYLPSDFYSSSFEFEPEFSNSISRQIFRLEQKYSELKSQQMSLNLMGAISRGKPTFGEPKELTTILEKRDQLLEELICNYVKNHKGYIFTNTFDSTKSNEIIYNRIASQNAIVNKQLKSVSKSLSIKEFSFHSARHTFAYLSRKEKTDIFLISKCLGHSSLSITEKYLREFEDTEIYKANDQMVILLKRMYNEISFGIA